MVSTRLALIAVGSVVAATFALQEANAEASFLEVPVHSTTDGCNKEHEAIVPTRPNTSGAARCCSIDGSVCHSQDKGNRGSCFGKDLSFTEAVDVCSADGMRLCTEPELASNMCCTTGCGYDQQEVWFTDGKNSGAAVEEPPATMKSEAKLKGCYKDASDRAMAGSSFSGDVTPKTCNDFCAVLGFDYFGIQDHHYCYCGGADYGKHGTLKQDQCNTPCTSHPGVMCGGKWANSIYKVAGVRSIDAEAVGKPALESLGCYTDASDRAMGGNTFSGDVTPEICSNFCNVLGFSYFGLQHFDHCFCGGADYAKLGSLPEHKCNTPCNSLPSAMCGGTWANSVYKVRE